MRKKIGYLVGVLLFCCSSVFAMESINKVSFVQDGEISKLIIDTSGEVIAEKFHLVDNKQILVDVKGVTADSKTLRPINTSEFSGSTVYVSAYQKEGSSDEVRFAIQLRDNVQSKLSIQNNRIVVDIENRFGVFAEKGISPEGEFAGSPDTSSSSEQEGSSLEGLNVPKSNSVEDILENLTLSGNKKYVGRRISINVKNLPLGDVLNMIADTSGFNIIIDDSVTRKPPMSITLTNIPWDEALDTILTLNKLVAEKHANILQVKTEEDYVKEKQAEIEAREKLKKKDPIVTKVFPISFGKLDDIINVIKEYKSERGGTLKDERTNTLIVKDTVENIEKMKKIIELLDTTTPQVLIEAKIVEAEESVNLNLGINNAEATYQFSGPVDGTRNASFTVNPTGGESGVFGVSVGVFKRLTNLDFNIQLLEENKKAKIISSPRVVTQNKETAKIATTTTKTIILPAVVSGGANVEGGGGTQDLTASLSLDVTPQISNDGTIALKIAIMKGEFGATSGSNVPDRIQNEITTNVLVDNGSTVVIGGLYTTKETEGESGIPFLKDIPLIGWLFKKGYNTQQDKRELIAFITPRIVNSKDAGTQFNLSQ